MKKLVTLILAGSIIFTSCSDEPIEVEKSVVLKNVTLTAEDTLSMDPKVKGQGHTGDFAFRTDSVNQYSAGFVEYLQDSLVNSKIRVCVNFWAKSTNPQKGDCLALSFCKKDGACTWNSIDVVNYTTKPNEWVNIIDSITYTAEQFNDSGSLIKVFAFNPNKITTVDFDDINIQIKKVHTVLE